ncbi:MAG TPA: class I SAM-dependent rRNA methyltransferase [Polyangia bacterium]|nr:class I SAM-dependent rRNA methyltransferase [Polyangia bacterium]
MSEGAHSRDGKLPRVRLRKELAAHVRSGHPWLYADALDAPRGLETGAAVDVLGRDGKFLARGLYDARSPIAVRIYTLDARQPLDGALVRARVESALRARRGAFDASSTDAFRWLNGEGDLLPGVTADVYRSVAVLRLDGDAVRALRDHVVAALVAAGRGIGIQHVYERSRGGRGEALHGGEPPSPVEIRELGVRYAVDVAQGQKTGFFLDQRENRRAIRPFAAGERVANLFGYTGGFSVHAALAGASEVATVDSAAAALENARANFRLNGLDPERHEFAAEDAFAWLERARAGGRRFGLVIVDPPSFAPSERALGKALKAYRDLNALALGVVEREGVLASASCSSHVDLDAFVGMLRDAADKARRPLRLLELRGQPADHPTLPAFPEGRYLKLVLARCVD